MFGLAGLIFAQPPAPKATDKPAVLQGYPPEVEDENRGPIKRRVIIEEEGPPPVTVPPWCYYARMEDLARAAADTKNPALKALLAKYVVAFDRITATDNSLIRVSPLPFHREAKYPNPFGIFQLNDRNEPLPARSFDLNRVRRIDHFEELLLIDAERLLKPPLKDKLPTDDADPRDCALAAENLASAALLFYETARDLGKRRGSGWDRLRSDTISKLADIRLQRLRIAADRKDWNIVRTLGARMANLYPGNIKLLEEVYAARLAEGILAAQSEELSDLERARELLVEFESRFPGSKNTSATKVRETLQLQKDKLYKRAEIAVKTENKEATRLLRTIEALDPNYPGLRDLQGQLKGSYAVLTVGVNRLPTSMSPVSARSDADRMAVELVFESLITAIPDETLGVCYTPGLAASFPGVISGARDVKLQRPVDWAGLSQQYADAADVAGTIRLLKGNYHGTWAAANVDWLADSPRVEDQAALRIHFHGGHPYPLSLLNFKILPARWLTAKGIRPDDPKFALHPFGTGPFKALAGADGKVTSFVANPNYGRRPGRLGQPFIKEVRFVDVSKKLNLPAEFKTEQLHLLPDVPTGDLSKFTSPEMIGRVNVVTAAQNRRVWILAVNHRRPALRSVPLRRGIIHAIDRETILNQAFRSGRSEFHKAATGPFPPETWATPRLAASALFNRDVATARFIEHNKTVGNTILRLAFPAEDPRARTSAELIKKQVESLGTSLEGKITIQIDALPINEFENAVYREANFDLAYIPFDYPDDWYSFALAAMLDPGASAPGCRNIGGYLDQQSNTANEDQLLAKELSEIRRYADFVKLTALTHKLHSRFLDAAPFIPLWQLDRHMVISAKLQISFDGEGGTIAPKMLPPSIFTQIGRWKLD